MLNMVDRTCTALMKVVAHCLAVGGMLATALRWASAFVTRRSGSGRSNPAHGLPLAWQQLLDPAVCQVPVLVVGAALRDDVEYLEPGVGGGEAALDRRPCAVASAS